MALASIPFGFALYKFSTGDPDSKPWLTSLIEKYQENESKLERDNALHTAAAEQAAYDRHLFHGQNPGLTIELMFPEYVIPTSLFPIVFTISFHIGKVVPISILI